MTQVGYRALGSVTLNDRAIHHPYSCSCSLPYLFTAILWPFPWMLICPLISKGNRENSYEARLKLTSALLSAFDVIMTSQLRLFLLIRAVLFSSDSPSLQEKGTDSETIDDRHLPVILISFLVPMCTHTFSTEASPLPHPTPPQLPFLRFHPPPPFSRRTPKVSLCIVSAVPVFWRSRPLALAEK